MTYIPYIYIIKENGFIEDTKLQKDIDLSTLQQGNNITSFYNENYPLYNIYFTNDNHESAIFENGELIFISQEKIVEKIKNIFPFLINQVASSNVSDLLNDYKNTDGSIKRPSLFKEYLDNFSYKTQSEIHPVVEQFSLITYKNIVNELHFLCATFDNQQSNLGHFVKASIRAFNTFLAYDNIITDITSGLFSSSRNDNNEKEIFFSNACHALDYANNMCNATINLGIKKDKKIKP